jgi:1,4-dihydroxy-6-naphthoate synthase
MTAVVPTHIRIGHSPDPDDAFMFWALASGRLLDSDFTFEQIHRDIETLNTWALEGRLEVTAISLHAYPYVQEHYTLLPHGASMGDGYGPILVCRPGTTRPTDASRVRVAIPGTLTTAWLTLNLWGIETLGGRFTDFVVVPFDEIGQYVLDGKADVGLLIHEGQLTYQRDGLGLIVDLGVWFGELTGGLPLPLGCNTIRRDLGAEAQQRVSEVLGRSIELALEHRSEALEYALGFGRGLDTSLADRFVGMYVNELTCDYGDRGRAGINELLTRAQDAGLFAQPLVELEPVADVRVDWLAPAVG